MTHFPRLGQCPLPDPVQLLPGKGESIIQGSGKCNNRGGGIVRGQSFTKGAQETSPPARGKQRGAASRAPPQEHQGEGRRGAQSWKERGAVPDLIGLKNVKGPTLSSRDSLSWPGKRQPPRKSYMWHYPLTQTLSFPLVLTEGGNAGRGQAPQHRGYGGDSIYKKVGGVGPRASNARFSSTPPPHYRVLDSSLFAKNCFCAPLTFLSMLRFFLEVPGIYENMQRGSSSGEACMGH